MTSRRDWQLQQLGITQWALRRPTALQGEIAISIPDHVRLVMVAEELPALNEPLIGDVLRSLKLTAEQVLQLTPERVTMLPPDSRCNSWRLGETDAIRQRLGRELVAASRLAVVVRSWRRSCWANGVAMRVDCGKTGTSTLSWGGMAGVTRVAAN